MKIRYSRSGGLAAIRTDVELDSDSIPPAEAGRLDSLMSQHRRSGKKSKAHPDEFVHELVVRDGRSRVRICRNDSECSAEEMALFDYLQEQALRLLRRKRT